MISQFFILSPRGDTVITRDYLGNVPKVSSFLCMLLLPCHSSHMFLRACACLHAV